MKTQTFSDEKTWRKGQKQTYTDRPLTEAEKAFSADPDNYNLLFYYMKLHRLDPEEWYDILIIPYLQAVKKYLSFPELQEKHDFTSILFMTLKCEISNYYKSMNAQKRKPEGGFVSLDYVLDDESLNHECRIEAWWIDKKTSVERQVISKEIFSEFLDNIGGFFQHEEMKAVLFLLLNGYTKREIIKLCRDKFDNYTPESKWGSNDYDFIVCLLRSAFKETYGF